MTKVDMSDELTMQKDISLYMCVCVCVCVFFLMQFLACLQF
jgi:hypothetical protein